MVFGGVGADRIDTGAADDVAWGGSGDDRLVGGEGPDALHGGSGNDVVRGGTGDDRLWAGPGSDHVFGGPGDDTLHALAADHDADVLDCGAGRDTARVLASERSSTRIRHCEVIVVVTAASADDTADESDRDADAE
jgi:Ca2+-binding RTX toxin-like protein